MYATQLYTLWHSLSLSLFAILQVLLDSFEESIHVLQELADKNQRRVDKLEHVCQKQEKEHASRIKDLESMYTVSLFVNMSAVYTLHMFGCDSALV